MLVLTLTTVCRAVSANDSFEAKTQVYVDSDHTTVVSPVAAISRDAWSGGTLSASYVADVVSSASIDVVSNATTHMSDFRSEITAGVSQKLRNTTFSGGYVYSVENDYSSHNANFGLAQDFFDKNTTLAVGYTFSTNSIWRSDDQNFRRQSLLVNGISGSWTQVLDKATIMQLSYSFSNNSGYQASPYRWVKIEAADLSGFVSKVPETDPDVRDRHAIVAGLNRHLGSDSSLQGDYRLYLDSWGVLAHTVQLRYFVVLGGDVTLRLRERFYYQNGADFFRSHYTARQTYMTADRELSTFWSNIVGAKLGWRLPWVHRALELEAKVDFFYFKYSDFALLSQRVGADLEAGLNVIY
jgi:hypothetical protein